MAPNCGGAYVGVQGAAREGWTTGQGTPWGHPALCCRGVPFNYCPPPIKSCIISARFVLAPFPLILDPKNQHKCFASKNTPRRQRHDRVHGGGATGHPCLAGPVARRGAPCQGPQCRLCPLHPRDGGWHWDGVSAGEFRLELGILASVMGCGPVPEHMGQCQGVWADTMEGGPVPPAGTSRAGWGRFWGSTDGFGMGLGLG